MNKKVLIDAVPYPAVTPGASAELVRQLVGPTVGAERPVGVDQTNLSVIVDDSVVVKWLQPPVPEPHPGVVLLEHLAEVGFTDTPRFLGVYRRDGHVDAVLTRYVARSADGWEWYTDDILAWLDGDAAGEPPIEVARRLGALTARLHVALATPSSVITEPVDRASAAPIHRAAAGLVDEAVAVTVDGEGMRLRPLADRIRPVIERLGDIGDTVVQPIHGDLQVGQILRADGRLWVMDFDGNPLADAPTRRQRQPAAKDLAGLLQSIDHVARVAHRRRPSIAVERIERFIVPAIDAAHVAYVEELQVAGAGHLLDERLLGPLRVVQELHELLYAARHLPHWRYVPDAALPALLARPVRH